jgi:hypothetical protein
MSILGSTDWTEGMTKACGNLNREMYCNEGMSGCGGDFIVTESTSKVLHVISKYCAMNTCRGVPDIFLPWHWMKACGVFFLFWGTAAHTIHIDHPACSVATMPIELPRLKAIKN